MGLAVNVICRNLGDDRVVPRFSRYLRDVLGWTLTARPDPEADVYYLSGYFEEPFMRPWPNKPVAAYFTHREVHPPGNGKAVLFDRMARQVSLRIATAAMYAWALVPYGPTVQITPPVERHRFTPPPRRNERLAAGFSGFVYPYGRKGETLARNLVKAFPSLVWKASGRGWPVLTREYGWKDMPAFYQSLDILVVTALVEGVPMPPLEALACGVSIVIPRGVGLLDELGEGPGLYRYQAGNWKDCARAVREAVVQRPMVDREWLRAITEPYTITAWCEQHRAAFEDLCC